MLSNIPQTEAYMRYVNDTLQQMRSTSEPMYAGVLILIKLYIVFAPWGPRVVTTH